MAAAVRIDEDHVRGIHPLAAHELRHVVDAVEQEGRGALRDGVLDRVAGDDGPVHRSREDDRVVVVERARRPHGTVDELRDRDRLIQGEAGVEDDEPRATAHEVEDAPQRGRSNGALLRRPRLEDDLAEVVPVTREVDDVGRLIAKRPPQVARTYLEMRDEPDAVRRPCQPDLLGDLTSLFAEKQPVADRIRREIQHCDLHR